MFTTFFANNDYTYVLESVGVFMADNDQSQTRVGREQERYTSFNEQLGRDQIPLNDKATESHRPLLQVP